MLESSNTVLKNNKKSKQPRNAAQKDWSNTLGGYNAACKSSESPHHAIQPTVNTNQQQQQQLRLMVNPAVVPTPGSVLLNIGGRSTQAVVTQPMIMSQPLQFVQVSQIPGMQAIAPSAYLPLQTLSTQSTPTVASTTIHQQQQQQ
jgi:hypothetical protein